MKRIIDLSNKEARSHFLKGSSYFNGDMPSYISFEPILTAVSDVLSGNSFAQYKASNPAEYPDVNYNFIANKDGRFAWRPYELMHPAGLTHQCLYFEQPHTFEQILFIQTAEPALVGHA